MSVLIDASSGVNKYPGFIRLLLCFYVNTRIQKALISGSVTKLLSLKFPCSLPETLLFIFLLKSAECLSSRTNKECKSHVTVDTARI